MRARTALALLALVPATASAQDVTEEVEGGGMVLSPEDLAPPEVEAVDEGGAGEALAAELDAPDVPEVPAPPAGPVAPEPTELQLANGMRVLLQPVPGRRFAAVVLSYRVGSADAPEGWSGLSHLTEHLMFSGTDRLGPSEIYLRLEAAGAVTRNGETTLDRSTFYCVLPSAQLRWALWIESQRMARMLAGLDEARLRRERALVLHEGSERGLYGWRGLWTRTLYGAVMPIGHPYDGIVERADDVRAVRLRHVQWFFQRHFAPDRATLAIVGGFDPTTLRAEIERHFGPIRRSAPPLEPEAIPPVAPLEAERRIDLSIQDRRARLTLAWPTPALYDEGDAALDVIAAVLTDERDGPLHAALIDTGLAVELDVRQRSHARGSVFTIDVRPAHGQGLDAVQTALDEALDAARTAGLDEAAVGRAVSRWARRQRLRQLDLDARARALATATERYIPSLERERQRYEAVDVAAVARTFERWLPRRRRVVLRGIASLDAPSAGAVVRDTGATR